MIRNHAAADEPRHSGRAGVRPGLYVLYEELFVSYSGIHGRYQLFTVGLILLGSGVVWLWFYVAGDIVLKRLSGEE
jgi:hypothetical protein